MALHRDVNAFIAVWDQDRLFSEEVDRRLTRQAVFGTPAGQRLSSVATQVFFQFVDYQSGIDDQIVPVLNQIRAQGRPLPYVMYSSTENRRIAFSAIFHDEDTQGEALQQARRLQAFMMPWRNSAPGDWYTVEFYPPPRLVLGLDFIEVILSGYLTRCDIDFGGAYSIDDARNARPQQVVAAIEFMVDGFVEYNASDFLFKRVFNV